MRITKHALLSLIRKPAKALMIFCIMLLVFCMVFTGIIIKNSIGKSKEYVRTQLGAIVEFAPDYVKALKNNAADIDYQSMTLPKSVATEIGNDPRVDKTYYVNSGYALGDELKSGISMGGEDNEAGEIIISGDFGNDTYINMMSSNQEIPLEFDIGNLTLVKGRYISSEELKTGANTVLISNKLAAANNLDIGDTLKLKTFEGKKSSLEIIGIYSGAAQFAEDNIYTTSAAVKPFSGFDSSEEISSSGSSEENYSNVYFKLKNPLDISSFIEQHEDKLPSEYTKLTANEDEFIKLTKPLDIMETITTLLIWVIFIAGALIITSIITIFVRDRKFEIGLLLASGEAKMKIALQYILEIAIVAVLAFILSAGISQISSSYVGQWIVENQLIEDKIDSNSMDDMFFIGDQSTMKGDVDINSIAKDFNVSADFATIINLFLLSMGILVIAAGTPIIIILRYKPREALQD